VPAPLIVAHRGAWEQVPQNSPAALEAAIELGCEMVELDVRTTRDRELVVVHDARVGGVAVSAQNASDLRRRLAPGQAPDLEAMIECAKGRIRLDIELKTDDQLNRTLAIIHRHLDPSGYVVTSFLDGALAAVRALSAETRTGLLIRPGRRPRRLSDRLTEAQISFLAPHASLARAGLLAWAAERGLESFLWTVNDRRAARTLLADPRVTALITDRPGRLLQARSELSESEAPTS